jgi:hypothetical protein
MQNGRMARVEVKEAQDNLKWPKSSHEGESSVLGQVATMSSIIGRASGSVGDGGSLI